MGHGTSWPFTWYRTEICRAYISVIVFPQRSTLLQNFFCLLAGFLTASQFAISLPVF